VVGAGSLTPGRCDPSWPDGYALTAPRSRFRRATFGRGV